MYILGGVVILFLVMGCCVCLCKIGAKDAQPAVAEGYKVFKNTNYFFKTLLLLTWAGNFQPVPQPGPGTPMGANSMYDALPEKMPKGFSMKKKSKKQPSMVSSSVYSLTILFSGHPCRRKGNVLFMYMHFVTLCIIMSAIFS